MDREQLAIGCAVLMAIVWLAGILTLARRRALRDRQAERFAGDLGLEMGEDLAMAGEVAGVPVEISPDSVRVHGHGTRALIFTTRYSVTANPDVEWFLCERREDFADPRPDLDHEIDLGDEELARRYRLTASGEPRRRFWEDEVLRDALLAADPVWIHARPGSAVVASFRKRNLTERHEEAPLLRQGLHVALALASSELSVRLREQLAEEPPRVTPMPPLLYAFGAALLLGGVGGGLALRGEFAGTWQPLVVGMALAYLPSLLVTILAQRIFHRRGRNKSRWAAG